MSRGPSLSVLASLFLLQLALPTSLCLALQPWDGRPLVDFGPTLRESGTFFFLAESPFLQSTSTVSRGCSQGFSSLAFCTCCASAAEPGSHPHTPLSFPGQRARKIPIIIRRYLPDGSYEDWGVDELIITD